MCIRNSSDEFEAFAIELGGAIERFCAATADRDWEGARYLRGELPAMLERMLTVYDMRVEPT